MVRLTEEERRMLEGDRGDIVQRCMMFLSDYADAAGAERLIDLDGTVILHPAVHPVPKYEITPEEIEALASRGERFKVPTFANKAIAPGFIWDGWEQCGTMPNSDAAFHQRCVDMLRPFIKMGMTPVLSCNDYLVDSFTPRTGQHCAWTESSAVPYANAILGARSNFDGCFQTAYLGKVPEYDMHLDENRAATVLVECNADLREDMDYDLFGWVVGELLGLKVPALVGIGRPTTSQVVKMDSALNTAGQVRMYHIPGVTPEAPNLEAAFRGAAPKEKVVIEDRDLERAYEVLNCATDPNVDFVYLGCPHYNIEEVRKVADLLEGKTLKSALWVMTNPLSYKAAEIAGHRTIIEKAGGLLLSGTCVGLLNGEMPPADVMATDAAKQDYYITGIVHPKKLGVWYGTTEDCVSAAITGKWKGGWRR
jgi:predicted aconitase